MDQFYYISLLITSESQFVSNRLMKIDKPLDPQEALDYDERFSKWLETMPIPGEKDVEPAEYPTRPELTLIDNAAEHAAKLPEILERGRDPEIFGPYDRDTEADRAAINRRPYDWSNLGD